jgi:2-(1,2-epoxy-1,2-dihydrophenyl)acetyl-CoA isomerase
VPFELIHQYETVALERDGALAQVRIDRPSRMNALYDQVYLDLIDAVARVAADGELRALVLTGTGDRAFCAGGDMKLDLAEIADYAPERLLRESKTATDSIDCLRELRKPVIARVNGVAVGGGCDLALACDIVIASANASFGEFWVRRGIVPDMGGAYLLPRLIGMHKAKELLFTGDRISAQEAADIGLINRTVAPEELDDAAYGLAHRLAAMPTMAIGAIKHLLHSEPDIETYWELVRLGLFTMTSTDDHREGVAAFHERREPQFVGH